MLICDFCSSSSVVWRYPTRSFNLTQIKARSVEDWAACENCHDLIEEGQWQALAVRSLATCTDAKLLYWSREFLRELHAKFNSHRMGPAIKVDLDKPVPSP